VLINLSIEKIKNYQVLLNEQEIDKGIKEIFELLSATNIYVDKQAPWRLKKINVDRMNVVLSISTEMIKRSNFMLYPIIPTSCIKVFNLLNVKIDNLNFDNICLLPSKQVTINNSVPIFPRIDIHD